MTSTKKLLNIRKKIRRGEDTKQERNGIKEAGKAKTSKRAISKGEDSTSKQSISNARDQKQAGGK